MIAHTRSIAIHGCVIAKDHERDQREAQPRLTGEADGRCSALDLKNEAVGQIVGGGRNKYT